MMVTLVISLPLDVKENTSNTEVYYDYCTTSDEKTVLQDGRHTIDHLPKADQWVGVIRAEALSWHQIDIPNVPAKRLQEVVQGILEENLIEDINDLHIVVQPNAKPGDKNVLIAVANKQQLDKSLRELKQKFGNKKFRLVPTIWPTKEKTALVQQRINGSHWIYVTHQQTVLAWPLDSFTKPESFGQNSLLTTIDWEQTSVFTESHCEEEANKALEGRVASIATTKLISSLQSPWNLAQLSFKPTTGIKSLLQKTPNIHLLYTQAWNNPKWHSVRIAFLLLLGFNLLGLNAWAWVERGKLQAKEKQILAISQAVFPDITDTHNLELQIQKALEHLERETRPEPTDVKRDNHLAQLLVTLKRVAPELQLDTLTYQNGGLTLERKINDVQIEELKRQGINVIESDITILLKGRGN